MFCNRPNRVTATGSHSTRFPWGAHSWFSYTLRHEESEAPLNHHSVAVAVIGLELEYCKVKEFFSSSIYLSEMRPN